MSVKTVFDWNELNSLFYFIPSLIQFHVYNIQIERYAQGTDAERLHSDFGAETKITFISGNSRLEN